jgi:acyl carrier protein
MPEDPRALEQEIARMIVESLALEDLAPEAIAPDAPLFGAGLGLDSIDALEIGLALHRRFGIALTGDGEEVRQHLASVRSLARFVAARRTDGTEPP